jgi:hypothetical protein
MIANTIPPTGDPNIPSYIQLAKDIMQAIKVRMGSGDVVAGDLGIEGVDDFEEEEEEPPAGEEANNLLDDFNENDLIGEIEEQEREHHRAEWEECLAEIQRQEREQKLEEEKRQRERDHQEEERREDRKAQRDMMSMLMMAMVGCSMSGDDSSSD